MKPLLLLVGLFAIGFVLVVWLARKVAERRDRYQGFDRQL